MSPSPGQSRRSLYPETEPFASGFMETPEGFRVYYEECGNPKGKPCVILHGGPGGAINPTMRRFFDPKRWRMLLFDQRGCGRSLPNASLEHNTTWTLIEDIEALRKQVGCEKWTVFGGSWGSTLALAYAATHPERVEALVLRGIFTLTEREVRWFYQDGASAIFPDAWEKFLAPIPEAERGDLLMAYHRRLTHPDLHVQREAAAAWSRWEGDTISIRGPEARPAKFNETDFAVAFARIECHYFVNDAWVDPARDLLANVGKIRGIPGVIVQGRYDVVCPMDSAWALHRAWPEAELVIVGDAGHSANEPGITSALIEATDRFR